MEYGNHCSKMGADSLAENTQNAPKIFGQITLSKAKKFGIVEKSSLQVSVVRELSLLADEPVVCTISRLAETEIKENDVHLEYKLSVCCQNITSNHKL